MKRREFIGGSTAAVAGPSLLNVSASAQDSAKLVLSTWGNPGEQELMKGFTQQISDAHDIFEVEYRGIPTDYPTKILTQLNGGTAPDMLYNGVPIISTFVHNGSIQDLSPFLDIDASVSDPADFAEGLRARLAPRMARFTAFRSTAIHTYFGTTSGSSKKSASRRCLPRCLKMAN